MKALVLNIGNEVLNGRVINTNASEIAKHLNTISIEVGKIIVVSDSEDDIIKEVTNFLVSEYEILITTGGLGPTHDDITKEVITKLLGLNLQIENNSKEKLANYFNGKVFNSNLKQAYFPKNSIILENKLGTANGLIIKYMNKHIIMLVGPPLENETMFPDVLKYLSSLKHEKTLVQEFLVMGGGESYFEDILDNLINKYKNVSVSPYASVGKILYIIKSDEKSRSDFSKVVNEFKLLLKDYIMSDSDVEIEEILYQVLKEKNYTISFAESCTGGMIASKLINVSGASKVIQESLVTYSDKSKIEYLNVSSELIDKYTSVSIEVAKAMVEGLYAKTKANVCLAVTGYADGLNAGTMYYGIKINNNVTLFENIFKGDRNTVRLRATMYAYYKLITLLRS